MKFAKILGKCDRSSIQECEEKISSCFLELAMPYDARAMGSKLGGDIFIYQMVSTLPQICDARSIEFDEICKQFDAECETNDYSAEEREIILDGIKAEFGGQIVATAATNGREFFYNPAFINKLSRIGLRLVVGHEGWHSILTHPTRRGSRNPSLWNIAVDIKANFNLMDDLRNRGFYDPSLVFQKELGDFITLKEYSAFLRDPFHPPERLSAWSPMYSMKRMLNPGYKDLNDKNQGKSFYFAEPNLPKELMQPEDIYDYLLNCIPKCKECGKIGIYKKPDDYKKLEAKIKVLAEDE